MKKGIGCILLVVALFGCGRSESNNSIPVSVSLYATDTGTNSILVFNNPSTVSGNVVPDRAISGSNTTLISPNGLWLDSVSNRLFVASAGNNSILVFDNVSALNGNVAPDRTISGSNTTLNGPIGLWLDSNSNRLYVANANNSSILVFNHASSVNGNVAPDRTISGPNTTLVLPAGLWVGSDSDRLYVTDINSAILVFDNASTMNGNVAPGRTISGSNTTLKGPFGAWLDSSSNRLYVANVEDNSILVFNNANTVNGNVAPDRTISGSNTTLSAPEGIWLDLTTNQLYVANGNNKSILVFNNASTVNGNVTPDRTVIGPNTTLNTPVDLWLETITIS